MTRQCSARRGPTSTAVLNSNKNTTKVRGVNETASRKTDFFYNVSSKYAVKVTALILPIADTVFRVFHSGREREKVPRFPSLRARDFYRVRWQ